MDVVRIYIVEDMAIPRASLESILISNNFKIAGSVTKAETAWDELQKVKVDLVLLDINLAGKKNGVWLAEQVRKYLNIPIVFLTAYGDQETLEKVIKTKPDGYLMKPYQEPTLLTTINIALSNFLKNKDTSGKNKSSLDSFIFIKEGSTKVKLKIEEIYFVKSDGNYLEIKLENKAHLIRSKLSEFQKLLPSNFFFQSHQRYLLNINKIALLGKDFVKIKNEEIPVSLKYKKAIQNVINNGY